jgi:hypothetical protein
MKHVIGKLNAENGLSPWYAHGTGQRMITHEFESEYDSNEDFDEGSQPGIQVEGEFEFGDTKLENLVRMEGPQQILQLTLQHQADDFMKEEITNADDYADWIQWATDGERRKQNLSEAVSATGESVLLQVQRMEITASGGNVREQIIDDVKGDTRWKDICQKLIIDQDLNELKRPLLWKLLERYQDVFAWNKGELGCYTVREHSIDTQGFPPCRVAPGRL